MAELELIIVGGGLAAARAIEAYRDEGGTGRIGLVPADNRVPSHRPPLSKRFLPGEADEPNVGRVRGQPEETESRLKELLRTQPRVSREALDEADDPVAALR